MQHEHVGGNRTGGLTDRLQQHGRSVSSSAKITSSLSAKCRKKVRDVTPARSAISATVVPLKPCSPNRLIAESMSRARESSGQRGIASTVALVSHRDIIYSHLMTQTDITRATVLLTGPTSGIGAGMLRALLRHPARPHLVLLAGIPTRWMRRSLPPELRACRPTVCTSTLADLVSVRDAITEVLSLVASGAIAPLDAALLNAGTQFMSRTKRGAQGHERTFTVNVIAQHLLVSGLTPLLAPEGHIVVMGSSTHRGKKHSFNLIPDPQWEAPADLATPDPVEAPSAAAGRERGGIAYASSKLALVTASHVWAQRVAAAGGRLNTYDPGLTVGTGLVREMSAFRYWVWRRIMPVMAIHPKATTPRITGRHAVALALGDTHAGVHDGYIEIGVRTQAEQVTFDADRQRDLLAWLDETVAPFTADASRARKHDG